MRKDAYCTKGDTNSANPICYVKVETFCSKLSVIKCCFLILSIFFPNSINIFNKEASIAIELPLETKIPPNLKFNDPELPKIEVISNDMPIINSSEIFNIDIANLKYNLSLPDLHIDIHVYSEMPNERFVFINMRKYKEGEVLIYGPNIQTITAEGVILNYKNINFLLAKN